MLVMSSPDCCLLVTKKTSHQANQQFLPPCQLMISQTGRHQMMITITSFRTIFTRRLSENISDYNNLEIFLFQFFKNNYCEVLLAWSITVTHHWWQILEVKTAWVHHSAGAEPVMSTFIFLKTNNVNKQWVLRSISRSDWLLWHKDRGGAERSKY